MEDRRRTTNDECRRLWSADGTWERLLQQVQAAADAAGEIDWDISVDSTIVRAHRHAADARTDPPSGPGIKGGRRDRTPGRDAGQSLLARLVEAVLEARAWASSRGGFTSKLHLSADGRCRPLSVNWRGASFDACAIRLVS